jgi:hypothetical protein
MATGVHSVWLQFCNTLLRTPAVRAGTHILHIIDFAVANYMYNVSAATSTC